MSGGQPAIGAPQSTIGTATKLGSHASLLSPGGDLNTLIVSFLHPGDAAVVCMAFPATSAPHAERDAKKYAFYHAKEGNIAALRMWTSEFLIPDRGAEGALAGAACVGDISTMKLAVLWGAEDNYTDHLGDHWHTGTLISAASNGHEEAALLALRWGGDVESGFAAAVENGHKKIAGKLLCSEIRAIYANTSKKARNLIRRRETKRFYQHMGSRKAKKAPKTG